MRVSSLGLLVVIESVNLLVLGLEYDGTSERSDGGKNVEYNEYPFFAMIGHLSEYFRVECGGAFLTPRLVITAARCIRGNAEHVAVGVANSADWGKMINNQSLFAKIKAKHYYPDLSGGKNRYDSVTSEIAIIELENSTEYPVQPLQLPSPIQWVRFMEDDLKAEVITAGSSTNLTELNHMKTIQFQLKRGQLFDGDNQTHDFPFELESSSAPPHRRLLCKGEFGSPFVSYSPSHSWYLLAIHSRSNYDCANKYPAERKAENIFKAVDLKSAWMLHTVDRQVRDHTLQETMDQWSVNPNIISSSYP